MDCDLQAACAALDLDEGVGAVRDFLENAYLYGGIPVRDMARALGLPVPVTAAIKNELKKRGFLGEGSGIRLSPGGRAFVLSELGFANVDVEKYLAAVGGDAKTCGARDAGLAGLNVHPAEAGVDVDKYLAAVAGNAGKNAETDGARDAGLAGLRVDPAVVAAAVGGDAETGGALEQIGNTRSVLPRVLPPTAGVQEICPITGFERELAVLEEIYAHRPAVDTALDQSMCTPETGLRRALLILREGGAVGRRIACVGDDDLVSVALSLVLAAVSEKPAGSRNGGMTAVRPESNQNNIKPIAEITVFDADGRFLDYIGKVADERGFPVRRVLYNLRGPLPAEFRGAFDAAVTDPPYTLGGLGLFFSRICALLEPAPNKCVYLSYAHKSPQTLLEAQKLILGCGCLISRIFPKFNAYIGAQMLGGVSDMLVLRTAGAAPAPPVAADERFDGAIYT
ncbi:MAG: bis-aminopropyl spermidine synthase family protein, partial [Firmicutes bacterium]|nr:bis-aminopropyl spermidine synthase family protein [Bacillota bacterium]